MARLEVSHAVTITAPRSIVWQAITSAELLSEWFGDSARVDASPGSAGEIASAEWGAFALVVDRVDEPDVFAFRWARDPGTPVADGSSTLVTVTLTDAPGGTEVTVVETGWEALSGDVEAAMAENLDGWREELGELVDFLEKQDSV